MALYVVFTGNANFRLNFWEVDGKGLSATTRPEVRITVADRHAGGRARHEHAHGEATDAENEITGVEFFVDGENVGDDDTAPYSVDWTQTEEDYYVVHAVATNDAGLTRDSRKVALHRRRVRRPPAVDDVRQHDAGGDVRPARRATSRSAPPGPTSGRAPTSTAPSTCPAARPRTSRRWSRSPRSTAPTPRRRRASWSATT